jgi:EpsI family protein
MDDYVNRGYTDDHANSLELYIGYHASQRSGELIHSPRNCLPAAGWEWARKGRLAIDFPGLARFEVNDFRIVKGLQQRVVLYWYQGRGRAIPGEYEAKFWTIADALIRHRTDGALVRIVTPIQTDEAAARAVSVSFLRTLCPCLQELIPN